MQAAPPPETVDTTGPVEGAPTWRFQLGGLLLVSLVVVAYVVGVLVPYFVNDLHLIPLAEVSSGAHDPKDLWPYDTDGPVALLQGVGLLAVTVGLLVVLGTLFVTGWTLWEWRGRTTRSARAIGRVTLVLCVVALVSTWSPWGRALTRWMLD